VSTGRIRRALLTALVAAGIIGVVAVLPRIATTLSREAGTAPRSDGSTATVAVRHLDHIGQLQTAFNADAGLVRVYLLLSPT
jgi:hypothetical protein